MKVKSDSYSSPLSSSCCGSAEGGETVKVKSDSYASSLSSSFCGSGEGVETEKLKVGLEVVTAIPLRSPPLPVVQDRG